MKPFKIYMYIVGTMACLMGLMLCSILLFPSVAMEYGVTDGGLRAQFILFVGWMFLFAVSLHVYAGEMRRK
jgi:hypothetical protein